RDERRAGWQEAAVSYAARGVVAKLRCRSRQANSERLTLTGFNRKSSQSRSNEKIDSWPVTSTHSTVSMYASLRSRPRSTSLRKVSMPSLNTVHKSESSPDQFGCCSGKNCSGRTKSGSKLANAAGSTGSGNCCAIVESLQDMTDATAKQFLCQPSRGSKNDHSFMWICGL